MWPCWVAVYRWDPEFTRMMAITAAVSTVKVIILSFFECSRAASTKMKAIAMARAININ